MNENIRFGILIVLVVAAVGGAWYFLSGRSGDTTEVAQTVSTPEPVEPEGEPAPTEDRTAARPASPFQVSSDRTRADSDPRAPRRTGNGTIKGAVKLADSEAPVANATVRIVLTTEAGTGGEQLEDGPHWEAETAADGTYEFKRIPYGYFAILASTDDLFGIGGATITDDELLDVVDITMKPAGAIAGLVINEAGEPVADARVYPEKTQDERNRMSGSIGMAAQVPTNNDGTFYLPHLWEGAWQLTVKAENYAVLASDYIPVGTLDAELVLSPGGHATGEVVAAETGDPIPDIKVVASSDVPRAEDEAKTDEEGRFELPHLADAKYRIAIEDDTRLLSGKPPEFTIAGGDSVDDLRLIVAIGGVVTGRAYDVRFRQGVEKRPNQCPTGWGRDPAAPGPFGRKWNLQD